MSRMRLSFPAAMVSYFSPTASPKRETHREKSKESSYELH
jgi:hypothetical protein